MFSACGYIYIFLEEVLFGEFGVIPVEEGYEEEIVCHGDPEGVPEVELDWLSKRKGLEVALGVEDLRIGVQMPKLHIIFHTHLNFQLLPEIPNHLCNSAASSNNNMAKFAQNEIIWALYSKQNQLWPAKICKKVAKDAYEVVFFMGDSGMENQNVRQRDCKPFDSVIFNEKDCSLALSKAYKIACKEILKSRQRPKDSSEDTLESVDGTVSDLRNLLKALIGEARVEKEWKKGVIHFTLHLEDCKMYLREGFCQKLNFVLNERDLDGELQASLRTLHEKMREMVLEQFTNGNL